ncbi:MAG: 50S ribosomal protein L11 methyltransferase [Gemmatimonadota bacterium]
MSKSWWRVSITGDPADADAIAAVIVAVTGNGVEEPRAGTLCTTLESEAAANDLARQLTGRFGSLSTSIESTEPVDWSTRWRDGIITRTFGRLILTPSWLPVSPAAGQVVVTIDPESAFGSGEHGSTRGALALLEQHLLPGQAVLDLGSGSGILAIAAVKLGARRAIGIEVDEESMPIADDNARRNQVEHAVTFLLGDAGELAPLAGPADLICSNILRTVNTVLMPSILRALGPGGTMIFAGMEEGEAELFLPVLAQHGLEVVADVRDGGWWSVAARRP